MSKRSPNDLRLTIKQLAFFLGFTSCLSQVVLLRELVVVFYGNETAYAVILSAWLFWVSVGSFLVSRLPRRLINVQVLLPVVFATVAVFLPLTVVLTRLSKIVLGVHPGEIIGLVPMVLMTLVLLAPLTALFGAAYSAICRWAQESGLAARERTWVSSLYLWESLGAAAGGSTFSFILINILSAFSTVVALSALNLLAAVLGWKHRPRTVWFAGLSIVLLAATFALSARVDRWSRRQQWRGQDLVSIADSRYGNLALVKKGQQYSLYENGLLSFSTRDSLRAEETAHFPLLQHPSPGRVLLIGGGLGGVLEEMLKHPAVRIDYVELDPEVLEVARANIPTRDFQVLADTRVWTGHGDGRWHVKRCGPAAYDAVIVNLADPTTAMLNRYYSREFYQEVHRALTPTGVLSARVSSSENYLSPEARDFLRSLHTTLKAVFPDVKSIPGDSHLFLAAGQPGVLTLDPQVLADRIDARGIVNQYVNRHQLPFRLDPFRISQVEEILKQPGRLNTDTRPVAYLFDLVLWSTHFNGAFKKAVTFFTRIPPLSLGLIPLLLLLAGLAFRRRDPQSPVVLSIVTTGFSEIIFQVTVILAFQTLYGYAYYQIGGIVSSFMLGLALGSFSARRVLNGPPRDLRKLYRWSQAAITLYPLLIPLLFVVFRDTVTTRQGTGFLAGCFAVLPVVAGFLGGWQYPLAVAILGGKGSKIQNDSAGTAGFLYAADVMGAAVGAALTGTILIPLWGITAVALLCAGINGVVLVLLSFNSGWRKGRGRVNS